MTPKIKSPVYRRKRSGLFSHLRRKKVEGNPIYTYSNFIITIMADIFTALFGKKLTPEDQLKKWKQTIRTQERALERQIKQIEIEQNKVKKTIQQSAQKGDKNGTRMLALELVRSRKAVNRRIYV